MARSINYVMILTLLHTVLIFGRAPFLYNRDSILYRKGEVSLNHLHFVDGNGRFAIRSPDNVRYRDFLLASGPGM